MANKPLKPGPIGIVDQPASFIVLELAEITEGQTNRKWSSCLCPCDVRNALAIQKWRLVHPSKLLFSLPIQSLQEPRTRGLPWSPLNPAAQHIPGRASFLSLRFMLRVQWMWAGWRTGYGRGRRMELRHSHAGNLFALWTPTLAHFGPANYGSGCSLRNRSMSSRVRQ